MALRRCAKGLSRLARRCAGRGMGHRASPARAAASTTSRRRAGVPMTPPTRSPRATIWAPVRVATSMTASGPSWTARARASARTRRPSASVFVISTAVPSYMVMMSPGRWAPPPGMFSASASQASTRTASFWRAAARTTPRTVAAPAMSDFISGMEAGCLRDRPPESKVMPLPTRATRERARRGAQVTRTRRGGWAEPRPTPTMPPKPPFSSASSSRTSTSRPAAARSRARWAKTAGVRRLGGSSTRSRIRCTASARAVARAVTAAAGAPSAGGAATTRRLGGAAAPGRPLQVWAAQAAPSATAVRSDSPAAGRARTASADPARARTARPAARPSTPARPAPRAAASSDSSSARSSSRPVPTTRTVAAAIPPRAAAGRRTTSSRPPVKPRVGRSPSRAFTSMPVVSTPSVRTAARGAGAGAGPGAASFPGPGADAASSPNPVAPPDLDAARAASTRTSAPSAAGARLVRSRAVRRDWS